MDRRLMEAAMVLYHPSTSTIEQLTTARHVCSEQRYRDCFDASKYTHTLVNYVEKLLLLPEHEVIAIHANMYPYFNGVTSFENIHFNLIIRDQKLNVTQEDGSSILMMTFDMDDHTSYIDGIYPGPILAIQGVQSPGNFLLRLVDAFNNLFGIHSSHLTDVSYKIFGGTTSARLKPLFLMAYGSSWYMRHGFLPRDNRSLLDGSNKHTHGKILHLAHIRATSMLNFYTNTIATRVLLRSGVRPENPEDFIRNVTIGHFFELVLQQLFAGNYRSCQGILFILERTDDAVARNGYNIGFHSFVKRYDRTDEPLSSRVHRENTKMFHIY
jgi:hypothetical protein